MRWIGRFPRFSVATGLGAEEGKVKQAIAIHISEFLFEMGEDGAEGNVHGDGGAIANLGSILAGRSPVILWAVLPSLHPIAVTPDAPEQLAWNWFGFSTIVDKSLLRLWFYLILL